MADPSPLPPPLFIATYGVFVGGGAAGIGHAIGGWLGLAVAVGMAMGSGWALDFWYGVFKVLTQRGSRGG